MRLNNSIILERIYHFASLSTKRKMLEGFSGTEIEQAIKRYIGRQKTSFPCFLCVVQLLMFYFSKCRTWVEFGFHSIRCVRYRPQYVRHVIIYSRYQKLLHY